MTEYDPKSGLYLPSRRRFFFLSGLALAGTVVKGWELEPRPVLSIPRVAAPYQVLAHRPRQMTSAQYAAVLDAALIKYELSLRERPLPFWGRR